MGYPGFTLKNYQWIKDRSPEILVKMKLCLEENLSSVYIERKELWYKGYKEKATHVLCRL